MFYWYKDACLAIKCHFSSKRGFRHWNFGNHVGSDKKEIQAVKTTSSCQNLLHRLGWSNCPSFWQVVKNKDNRRCFAIHLPHSSLHEHSREIQNTECPLMTSLKSNWWSTETFSVQQSSYSQCIIVNTKHPILKASLIFLCVIVQNAGVWSLSYARRIKWLFLPSTTEWRQFIGVTAKCAYQIPAKQRTFSSLLLPPSPPTLVSHWNGVEP